MLQFFTFRVSNLGLNLIILAMWLVLVAGCSSRPKIPGLEEQTEKLATVMEKGGYAPSNALQIASGKDVWMYEGSELEVMMTAPTAGGPYPLIIYLPSLGENAEAGRLWRETWAKAGYAVFSMQALAIGQALKELGPERSGSKVKGGWLSSDEEDEDAVDESHNDKRGEGVRKHSKSGRSSELRYLGHEYFAADALKKRMEQLFWAYQQLKIRIGLGVPLYAAADVSKVVLAGYDLGAQTVTAVLGEDFMTKLPSSSELQPLAALVLSPSIDLAEGNVHKRFQKLQLPLLVITGSEDNDPYAISSASVRAAVWEFSPPGGKYLLSLTGNVHPLLAGANLGGGLIMDAGRDGDDAADKSRDGKRGGNLLELTNQYGGANSGRRHGGNSEGLFGGSKDGGERKNSDLGYKQVAAVYSISAAFLDAVVKNDEFAKFWIKDKAGDWLDRAGSLKIR
jgi:hypothetical protein